MKRIIILVAIALVTAGMLSADEAILIDFSKLTADISVPAYEGDEGGPNQNRQTVMDYGQIAGGSFTEEQKGVMKTSLAIENWDVVFNSSSQTVANMANTYTRESPSRQWGTVLGVRVHYPLDPAYSKATIRPPFEIPAYEPQANVGDDGSIEPAEDSDGITTISRFEDGFGVVKNVGTIRSVAINAYGLNFPHGLSVILIDNQGNEKACFMGYLNYDGWAELTWNNPQYVMEVRNRDLRLYPLYPTNTPFVKFGGLRLDRDADKVGGDFVAYFKDVKLIYDKAMLETDRDINDEEIWGIINSRETAKKVFEMERFGQSQILRYLDLQKQAKEEWEPLSGNYGFTPTEAGGGEGGGQPQ